MVHGHPIPHGKPAPYTLAILERILEVHDGYEKILCVGGTYTDPTDMSMRYWMERWLIARGVSEDKFIHLLSDDQEKVRPRDTAEEINFAIRVLHLRNYRFETCMVGVVNTWPFVPRMMYLWRVHDIKPTCHVVWSWRALAHPWRILGQIPAAVLNAVDPYSHSRFVQWLLRRRGGPFILPAEPKAEPKIESEPLSS